MPTRGNATIAALSAAVANPFSGLLPGQRLNGSTTSVSNLLKPFPEFSGVTVFNLNNGDSYFNQLAVRIRKRLSNGLQVVANYSHSRPMSKEVATDRPDYLAFSVIYDLPAGRGKHFLANANRVVAFALGNWQVAGEYNLLPASRP